MSYFDRAYDELKEAFPGSVVIGNAESPRRGAFEVTVNGHVLWSKLQGGQFPRAGQLAKAAQAVMYPS